MKVHAFHPTSEGSTLCSLANPDYPRTRNPEEVTCQACRKRLLKAAEKAKEGDLDGWVRVIREARGSEAPAIPDLVQENERLRGELKQAKARIQELEKQIEDDRVERQQLAWERSEYERREASKDFRLFLSSPVRLRANR